MYHTQEKRRERLKSPVICCKSNAWLGTGYYFWNDQVDAVHWGNNMKTAKGAYQIYQAHIDCSKVLNTVYNEEHYLFWIAQIEKAAKHISKKTRMKATLKEINDYFKEKAKWSEITSGVLFQDLPYSEDLLVINLNYRKRIQIAVYNLDIISNFVLHSEEKCI